MAAFIYASIHGKYTLYFFSTGSPDMFYHSSWSDLYIQGLGRTFFYIAGAIRNLHKLEEMTGNILAEGSVPFFLL